MKYCVLFKLLSVSILCSMACSFASADVVTGSPVDSSPSLIYNVNTGTVTVEDGTAVAPSLRGLFISTEGNDGVTFSSPLTLPVGALAISNDLNIDSTALAFSTLPAITNIYGTGFDFGMILPTGLTQTVLNDNLDILFQREVGGSGIQFAGDIFTVPEPSAFLFMLMIVAGVLSAKTARTRFGWFKR